MAFSFNTRPTGEFKFESEIESPNGKLFTLKGVRAMDIPGSTPEDNAQDFFSGLSRFFRIFGLNLRSHSDGDIIGKRTEAADLQYHSG